MTDTKKKEISRRSKLVLFYFNILLLIVALFLIGFSLYGYLVNNNESVGVSLYAGIVIGIYSLIAIFRDNPYKAVKETDVPKSDQEQS